MLILLESATENSCREFFEYYEGSLILDWKDFRLVSSVSMANLSSLLVTSFSSLRFLSNSLSSPCFRVARRCFSWSSVSDDLFFPSSVFCFFLVLFLALSFRVLSSAFLSSVLQSLKLCLLQVSHF